jgi:hypothetical protein
MKHTKKNTLAGFAEDADARSPRTPNTAKTS